MDRMTSPGDTLSLSYNFPFFVWSVLPRVACNWRNSVAIVSRATFCDFGGAVQPANLQVGIGDTGLGFRHEPAKTSELAL